MSILPADGGALPTPPQTTELTQSLALSILRRDFARFDTAAHGGHADGAISTHDLEAVRDGHGYSAEQRDAARYLLAHADQRTALDGAGRGDASDDRISRNDIDQYVLQHRLALQEQTLPTGSNQAWQTLNRDFARFDTAAHGGDPDGKISRHDLEAVRDGRQYTRGQRDAARYLLDHGDARDALDTATEGGSPDGTISRDDVTNFGLHHPDLLPRLAATTAQGSATQPTVLHVDATAPKGADWRNADNRAGAVSVYVDGKYYADATIYAENPGGVDVNLGTLGPGTHTIELRDSTAVGTGSDARLDPARVSVSTKTLSESGSDRDQALANRYAPVVRYKENGQAGNNTPLYTEAQVTHLADGRTKITYKILFTNEDGGDATDPRREVSRWGRLTDDETVYTVTLDRNGALTGFEPSGSSGGLGGDWRAQWPRNSVDGHPQLAIVDEHNHYAWASDHPFRAQNRAFAGAPLVIGENTTTLDVMNAHPWTWQVSGKEAQREAVPTQGPLGFPDGTEPKAQRAQLDQRIYLNLHNPPAKPGDGPQVSGGQIERVHVYLKDGRRLDLTLDGNADDSPSQTVSLALPEGVDPAQVARIKVDGLPAGSTVQAQRFTGEFVPVAIPAG